MVWKSWLFLFCNIICCTVCEGRVWDYKPCGLSCETSFLNMKCTGILFYSWMSQLYAARQIQEDLNVNNLFTDCIMNIVKGSVHDWNVKVLDSKLAYSRLKNCFDQYLVLVVLGSTTCLSFLPPVGELVKHFSLNVNYLFKDSCVKSLNTNWSSLVHFRNEIWQ